MPNAERIKLARDFARPIFVRPRTRWTRMQNLADAWRRFAKDQHRAFRREIADADEPLGFENTNDFAQMLVACGEKFLALTRRKFVRRAVAAASFDKCERAIIHHDVIAEKVVGDAESLLE